MAPSLAPPPWGDSLESGSTARPPWGWQRAWSSGPWDLERVSCLSEPQSLHLYNGNRKGEGSAGRALRLHCRHQLHFALLPCQWYDWSEKCLNPKPQNQAKLILDFGHSAVVLFLNEGQLLPAVVHQQEKFLLAVRTVSSVWKQWAWESDKHITFLRKPQSLRHIEGPHTGGR